MRFSKVNSTNFLPLFIIVFYTLVFFKNYIENENSLLYSTLTASYVILGIILTFFFFIKEAGFSILKIVIFILLVSSILTAFMGDNYRNEDYLLAFCYLGLSFIPLKYQLDYKLFLFFSVVILVFFGCQMVMGKFPDEVFPRVSRNFISVFLLVGCGYYFISCFQSNRNPSIFIVFATLILSIWATGRAGIISSSILFLFYPISLRKKISYKIILVIFLIILFSFLYISFESALYEFGFGRFKAMGLQSDRSSINQDYFNMSVDSFKNLMVGSNFKQIPSIVYVELNPHNSFIRLHAFYGFISFIIIIIMILYSLIKYLRNSNFLYLFLLIALLLRSYLDSTAFHGPFDPLLFYLIFYNFSNKSIIF